eukprot:3742410-Pleurochrysis_carterae.AAC.1
MPPAHSCGSGRPWPSCTRRKAWPMRMVAPPPRPSGGSAGRADRTPPPRPQLRPCPGPRAG